MMNWKGYERNRTMPDLKYAKFFLEALSKITKMWFVRASVQTAV